MFYEESKIADGLKCKKCYKRLDEPKLLACGATICLHCESSVKVTNSKYECPICFNTHTMSEDGLPVNQSLVLFLSVEPSDVSRGKIVESFKVSLNDIYEKMKLLSYQNEIGVNKIKEHCIGLRNKVQLITEETIQHINQFNEEFIKKIDDYEQDRVKILLQSKISEENLNQTFKELEVFHNEWRDYLKIPRLDDDLIESTNLKAVELIKKSEQEKLNLHEHIFGGMVLEFEANPLKPFPFGLFTTEKVKKIDSSILSLYEMTELMLLCELELNVKWELIYRATRDGFEASKFHSKCDNKPNSLVVIKSCNGNVFGGYTQQSWHQNGVYKNDPTAFIFSLINKENKPLKMKCISSAHAIYCDPNYGPRFGGGCDLYVSASNQINQNGSNLGHTYEHPEYLFQSNEARNFLAGSFVFQAVEIEVYSRL